ncbi:hypothetical protein EKQ25_13020, partial [Enterococcus faecalis]|nr:hypothetical protein [Enterococcus faecalis]EGO8235344.1 hypothetical protein [Enterococcus faecalis]EGO8503117.1 hypothetical protein [Enterococcus faecalis]
MKLTQVAKKNSKTVWEYLKLTEEQKQLTYGEVTITEELLRSIYTYAKGIIAIKKPEHPEKITGADFMWTIKTPEKEINMSFQAKRTYLPYSQYRKLSHTVDGIPQIEIFKRYSKLMGLTPYYILYNAIFSQADYYLKRYKHTDVEIANQGRKFQSSLGITVSPLDIMEKHYSQAYFDTITSDCLTKTLRQFLADSLITKDEETKNENDNVSTKEHEESHSDNKKDSGKLA